MLPLPGRNRDDSSRTNAERRGSLGVSHPGLRLPLNSSRWAWLGMALLLLAVPACGPFGISVDLDEGDAADPTPTSEAVAATATPTITVAMDPVPDVPELVWHRFASVLDESGNLLTVRPNQVGFEKSPVDFAMFWDYSGATGKIAYASEFFHPARGSNTSVSDLWVYDYESGEAAQWLPDNVGRATWSPLQPGHFSDQRLAAAIYNTEEGRYDLGLLNGPGQVEWLATCASVSFAWSPDATEIAYVAEPLPAEEGGAPGECQGAYVVSIEDRSVRQLADIPAIYSGWLGNRPLWAEEAGALLFTGAAPERVFWIIKSDGSETFTPAISENIVEEYLPSPQYSLWSSEHRSVIGQTEGMLDPWGVWVYVFSEDLRTIEDAYRINWGDYGHQIILVGWWEHGESVLLRDISNTSDLNPFGVAMVWSLSDQHAFELSYSRPVIEVPLYPPQARTGVEQVDQVIENFLVRKFDWRRDMIRTLTAGCTTEQFSVGPPPCPPGAAEGTRVEVFPYREHRDIKYVTPEALDAFLEFPLGGLYAVLRNQEGGFEEEWYPQGEYSIVFVGIDSELGVEVVVDAGQVVRIEFWPLTPVEYLHAFDGEYLLPPLSE